MKRPFLFSGILSLILSALSLTCNVYVVLSAAAILFLSFLILFIIKGKKIFKNSNNLVALVISVIVIISCVLSITSRYAPTSRLDGTTGKFTGIIIREPETHGEWTAYTLRGNHSMLYGRFKCTIVIKDNSFNIGDKLYLTVSCQALSGTYKNNNLADGIFVTTYVKSVNLVEKQASSFYTKLGGIRSFIKNQIFSVNHDDIGGVGLALLTGNRSFISDELYDKTKTCGVTHVMVVSGLHVGILSGILSKVLSKLKIKRKFTVILSFILFVLLISLCDFHTSAIRSVLMSVVFLSGSLANRRSDSMNSLGFAITVMTLFNPFISGSAAFLLSVFATFGVVFISPMVQYLTKSLRLSGKFGKLLNGISDAIIVSISATVCVLPISVYYFGYTSLLSPIVTVLIGFAVEAALILTALGIILAAIPFIKLISIPVIYVSGLFIRYINAVIGFFGNMDIFILNIEPEYTLLPFIFCSLLILVVWLLYNNKKQKERKNDDAAG